MFVVFVWPRTTLIGTSFIAFYILGDALKEGPTSFVLESKTSILGLV